MKGARKNAKGFDGDHIPEKDLDMAALDRPLVPFFLEKEGEYVVNEKLEVSSKKTSQKSSKNEKQKRERSSSKRNKSPTKQQQASPSKSRPKKRNQSNADKGNRVSKPSKPAALSKPPQKKPLDASQVQTSTSVGSHHVVPAEVPTGVLQPGTLLSPGAFAMSSTYPEAPTGGVQSVPLPMHDTHSGGSLHRVQSSNAVLTMDASSTQAPPCDESAPDHIRWADGAFKNSPAPEHVPLPSFVGMASSAEASTPVSTTTEAVPPLEHTFSHHPHHPHPDHAVLTHSHSMPSLPNATQLFQAHPIPQHPSQLAGMSQDLRRMLNIQC